MKNKIIKFLYKIFSFLADKTNGWKIFVSPKLFFGTLIVSVTAMSISSCKPKPEEPPSCYIQPPLCYDVIDTTQNNDTINDDVLCYFIGPTEENQN